VLDVAPESDAVLNVTSNGSTESTVSVTSLTFILVTTEDDDVVEISLNGKKGNIVGTPALPAGLEAVVYGGGPDNLSISGQAERGPVQISRNLTESVKDSESDITAVNVVVPQQTTYELEIGLIIPSVGVVGTASGFKVRILPIVGLIGDTVMVEGTEQIAITFVRKGIDLSNSLDVSFEYDWGSTASPADIEVVDSGDVTESNMTGSNTINFKAGSATATTVVKAVSNDGNEPQERFKVKVTDGGEYDPIDVHIVVDENPGKYLHEVARTRDDIHHSARINAVCRLECQSRSGRPGRGWKPNRNPY